MGENMVFLLAYGTQRNFYKFIMARLDVKRFDLKQQAASRRLSSSSSQPAKMGQDINSMC